MELTQDDKKSLREYIRMLEILASNRHIDLDIQEEFKMLEIEIEKLPSFVMGKEKGKKEGLLEVAKHLFKMNFPIDKILEVTGLSKSDLEKIKKED
jgi:predicted transposase/invertase (TIGR01784 family)